MPYAVAFAQEVRRFYPFAPFVGGRAVRDLTWQGEHIPVGSLVLLDIYGQNHDPALSSRQNRLVCCVRGFAQGVSVSRRGPSMIALGPAP